MKIAIVGTSKLTEEEEQKALVVIETLIDRAMFEANTIVTGDADGIDKLVRTQAKSRLANLNVHIAKKKAWNGNDGFKERNKRIVNNSDYVYSITTKTKTTKCYHCDKEHERTGGCWTLQHAIKLGKSGEVIVL